MNEFEEEYRRKVRDINNKYLNQLKSSNFESPAAFSNAVSTHFSAVLHDISTIQINIPDSEKLVINTRTASMMRTIDIAQIRALELLPDLLKEYSTAAQKLFDQRFQE